MKLPRVGLYAWGGPGTIRLLQTKYFDPQIDQENFLAMYDRAWLEDAVQTVGATDVWVTYSWGFSDATEQEDRDFIVKRLHNFSDRNLKTYAYIQGTNLVVDEFPHEITDPNSPFCRDPNGKLIPYSRGRAMTCPHNPEARRIIINRVRRAAQEAFSAIFVDNIFFGLPAWYFRDDFMSFSGCFCHYCRAAFQKEFGYPLPKRVKRGRKVVRDTIRFRTQAITKLIQELSDIAHHHGKLFGVNLYDPLWHTSDIMFGYNFVEIEPYLDYYLIENHHLLSTNAHLKPLLAQAKKPTFVVSYHKGIGFDPQFSQTAIDQWFTDAATVGFAPCLKATEYITDNTWHGFRWENLQPPRIDTKKTTSSQKTPTKRVRPASRLDKTFVPVIDRLLLQFIRSYYESGKFFWFINKLGIYQRMVQSPRLFSEFVEEIYQLETKTTTRKKASS